MLPLYRVVMVGLVLLGGTTPSRAQSAAGGPHLARTLEQIEPIVQESLQAQECAGAVVLVLHQDQVIYRRAFGQRVVRPKAEAMTVDTIFDLASLTKPVATATAIAQLVESGKIHWSDPIAKHWPAFGQSGKATVTIDQCLWHTSGLIADNPLADYQSGVELAWKNISQLKLLDPAGSRFRYSDVGFLTLGHLVEQVRQQSLDQVTAKQIFEPLRMTDTGFRPSKTLRSRIAPTGQRQGEWIRGEVHDPRAFALGGVAGHAGLFGTADDLARFARMILRQGELDGVRILQPETVRAWLTPQKVAPAGLRNRGWDVATGYSAPRGDRFPEGISFGHTGFTGTSLWIDPATQTAIIVLTSRLHPEERGNATPLRRKIGTLVGEAVGYRPVVRTGIDVLQKGQFKPLKNRRVGLVTNHTGIASDGTPTIDLFHRAPEVQLKALFSPEHGIRGALDEKVTDGIDAATGLPIYSLYGDRRKPTPEQLRGLDVLVYDIQDIGCRFYTYISTLGLVLEAAKEAGLPVIVLDRPNPLGGLIVEGPLRDPEAESFIAFHDLPLRHALTVGELARMFNEERGIQAELTVIPMEHWTRDQTWEQTGLTWRNPSPNMRHLTAAWIYPGVGLLETTNLSVGRGTERPFEWIGAPYLNGVALAAELNRRRLPGLAFVPVERTPTSSVFKNQRCEGVDILVLNRELVDSVTLGLHLADALRRVAPGWDRSRWNRLLVHQATAAELSAGRPLAEILAGYEPGLKRFQERSKKFQLYPTAAGTTQPQR